MSGLALTAAVTLGLYLASNQKTNKRHAPKKSRTITPDHFHNTGSYGTVKDITRTIHQPKFIVSKTWDKDLQGVPFRWLRARTGAVYKTYDPQTNFIEQ